MTINKLYIFLLSYLSYALAEASCLGKLAHLVLLTSSYYKQSIKFDWNLQKSKSQKV